MRPLVIVNPASRGGDGAKDWPHAAAMLGAHFGPFERRFTDAPGHAFRIARDEAERGRRLLVTFGGDGTISETARGILASGLPCELGVLPHGTGGDFTRSLATPARLADAARQLREGRRATIDVGTVAFSDGEEHYFVNSASFGLSGEVAFRANRSKKRALGYARHTIAATFEFDFPRVELRANGAGPRRIHITTVSLHNGRFFGGGMKMAPEAALTDGQLQLVVVKKMSPARLLRQAPLMYWGAHLGVAEVDHGPVTSLVASGATVRPIRVEVDGESPGCLPARFGVRPGALHIRLPRT